jgi:O-antigen/teichoic acid export membrane protein
MRRSFTRLVRPPHRRAPAEGRTLNLAERVAVNAAAQLASQFALALGGLLSVVVTTRYLDVRQYGALVTALIFVSLFALLTDFGMTTIGGRELAKSPEDADRILSSLGLMAALISLLALGIAIAVSQVAYAGPQGADVRKAILILLPQLLIVAPRSVALAYLVWRQKIYLSSFAGVATRVVTLGLVIAVAKADLGFVAMVVAYAAFPILGALLVVLLARTGLPRLRLWSRPLAMKLLKLSLPLGGVVVVNYLYFRLDLFLLSVLASKTDVALYGVAYKVIEVLTLIPGYLMVTLLPAMAVVETSSDRLNRLVQNAFSAMQFIAVPLIALSFYSTQILRVIAGDQYGAAHTALQLLMIGMALSFLQQVFGYTLVSQNRQGRALIALVAVLLVNLALNLVLIPLYKINGAAVALVISEALSLGAVAGVYSRIGALPSLHEPGKILLAGVVMLGLVLGTRNAFGALFGSPVATLFVGGTLSFAGYVLALRQLHAIPPAASSVIGNLLRRRSRDA